MKTAADPVRQSPPDRLHYATGELLGADDFVVEQTYHRRQLAQALLFLHGRGSVAGLKVQIAPSPDPKDATQLTEVQLQVQPGLALDGAGRLVEVPRPACLRLRRWFEFVANQPANSQADVMERGRLRAAWRADAAFDGGGAVVADVFLTFHPCERGYTPAFASGPFDALDASQPSRVRDAYELSLVLRQNGEELLPAFDPWSAVQGGTPEERLASARNASLTAWDDLAKFSGDAAEDAHGIPPGVDRTAVLLARVKLPASAPPDDVTQPPGALWTAAAWAQPEIIDNQVRNFVLPTAALRRLAGL